MRQRLGSTIQDATVVDDLGERAHDRVHTTAVRFSLAAALATGHKRRHELYVSLPGRQSGYSLPLLGQIPT